MVLKYNPIIYGKNDLERICSIDVKDNNIFIYTEDSDGTLHEIVKPNKYWILCSYKVDETWVKMNGNLYYQWGKQFCTYKEYKDFTTNNLMIRTHFFSVYNPVEALMIKDGYTYYKGLKSPKEVSTLSFDIETTSLNPNDDNAKVLLISNTFRCNGVIQKQLFCYDDYPTQRKMIQDWSNWVREVDPSIMLGHNINSFDLPYIDTIIRKEKGRLLLGRDKTQLQISDYESKFRVDGSRDLHYHKCKIFGREIVDTMFLAIRYDIARKYQSYGLKNIIKDEALIKKDRTFYDASQIRFKYEDKEEWKKIKEYCIDDSDDALALFDLMSPSYFVLSQSIPKSFQLVLESASGSQINSMMVRAYLQEAHSVPKANEPEQFQGAISLAIPGSYKNVLSLDVASLYPSLMLEYDIFSKEKDPKNHCKELLEYFTDKRLEAKKLYKETKDEYYNYIQNSAKIFINSVYGFLGSPGLNFNDPRGAARVTELGRMTLTKGIEIMTGMKYTEWEKINLKESA